LSVQALAALPSDSTSSLRRPSSPPALPRTSLATGPPGPNLQLSSSALPCGAALGISLRQPSGPASNQSHDWPSQTRPTTLIACCRSVALPSDRLAPLLQPCLNQASTCVLAQPVKPQPTTFHRQSILRLPFLSGLHPTLPVSPSGLPCGPPSGFALRLSFRSRLAPFASAQPSGRLPACTRLRLEPCGSRLHLLLPSSQPSGRLSLRCPAFASRPVSSRPSGNAIQLEPLTPGPNLAVRVARLPPSLWDRLSGLRLQSKSPGIGPEACSSTPCTCLAACASCSGQLPPA